MKNDTRPSRDVPRAAIAAIMLAAFTVSIGYGIVLPLLPYLIERLLGEGGKIAGATGLVTGAYSLALFVFAPVWGRLSDRLGRRRVLLIGLFGLGATMLMLAGLGTRQADGDREPWRHRGLGGGRTPV